MPFASFLPASTCHVSVENVAGLTLFGQMFAMAALISLLTGKTYYRRVIVKTEEPLNYWFSLGCLVFLAVLILGMLQACPQV
jgi:hypothetical protein